MTPKRLNPFAFPAETDLRFALLVLAAVALAIELGNFVPFLINPEWAGWFSDLQFPDPELGSEQFFQEYQTAFLRLASRALLSLGLPALITLAIFLLAGIL